MAEGDLIVAVTHELEAFAALAIRATTVIDGRALSCDVEGNLRQRLSTLEPLAQGRI